MLQFWRSEVPNGSWGCVPCRSCNGESLSWSSQGPRAARLLALGPRKSFYLCIITSLNLIFLSVILIDSCNHIGLTQAIQATFRFSRSIIPPAKFLFLWKATHSLVWAIQCGPFWGPVFCLLHMNIIEMLYNFWPALYLLVGGYHLLLRNVPFNTGREGNDPSLLLDQQETEMISFH